MGLGCAGDIDDGECTFTRVRGTDKAHRIEPRRDVFTMYDADLNKIKSSELVYEMYHNADTNQYMLPVYDLRLNTGSILYMEKINLNQLSAL